MSFSNEIKNELVSELPNARHCRIAELAALLSMTAVMQSNGRLLIRTENKAAAERILTLRKKLFPAQQTDSIRVLKSVAGKRAYIIEPGAEESSLLCKTVKAETEAAEKTGKADAEAAERAGKADAADGERTVKTGGAGKDRAIVPDRIVIRLACCKRAYLRGAFIAAGSVSDPEKEYHFEIVSPGKAQAAILTEIASYFDIDAKIIDRKRFRVVYVKDSEQIVDLLNVMEAHVALMKLENVRILKEMRNTVNRRVNCEAANIEKTVKAANRQIDDIRLIRDTIGFESLPPELAMTAQLRLEYPESSLQELGALHDKPLGRSGVNHRLQKLSDIAERLREG